MNPSQLIEKLKTDPLIEEMKMKEIGNGILLKTGINWKSWGEEIKIIRQTKGENGFDYQV